MTSGSPGEDKTGRVRSGRPRLSVMGWGLIAFLVCAALAAPAVFWLRQTMEVRELSAEGAR